MSSKDVSIASPIPERKPFLLSEDDAKAASCKISSIDGYYYGAFSKSQANALIAEAKNLVSQYGTEILSRLFFMEVKNGRYGLTYSSIVNKKYSMDNPLPFEIFRTDGSLQHLAAKFLSDGSVAFRDILALGLDPRDIYSKSFDSPSRGTALLKVLANLHDLSPPNARALWKASFDLPDFRSTVISLSISVVRQQSNDIWFHQDGVSNLKERQALEISALHYEMLDKTNSLPEDLRNKLPIVKSKLSSLKLMKNDDQIATPDASYSEIQISRQKLLIAILCENDDLPVFSHIFEISGLNTPERINARLDKEVRSLNPGAEFWVDIACIRQEWACMAFILDRGGNPWLSSHKNPLLNLANHVGDYTDNLSKAVSSLIDAMRRDAHVRYPDNPQAEVQRCIDEIIYKEPHNHSNKQAFSAVKSAVENYLMKADAVSQTSPSSVRRKI